MKIIITENQLKSLLIHEGLLSDKMISVMKNTKNILYGNIDIYKNVIPKISERYYGTNTIKSDAFRHILAAAFFTTVIGQKLTRLGGEITELVGAVRGLIKNQTFDSGWSMDSLNNNIGIELGNKNPKASIEELSKMVKRIVDDGNFYTTNKILYKHDKYPKK